MFWRIFTAPGEPTSRLIFWRLFSPCIISLFAHNAERGSLFAQTNTNSTYLSNNTMRFHRTAVLACLLLTSPVIGSESLAPLKNDITNPSISEAANESRWSSADTPVLQRIEALGPNPDDETKKTFLEQEQALYFLGIPDNLVSPNEFNPPQIVFVDFDSSTDPVNSSTLLLTEPLLFKGSWILMLITTCR